METSHDFLVLLFHIFIIYYYSVITFWYVMVYWICYLYIMLYNVLEEIKPNHTMELHDVASDNRLIKK